MGIVNLEIDLHQVQGLSDALGAAPKILFRELAKAYGAIGRYDIDRIRSNVSGSFNLRSQGAAKSFKYKSTTPSKATGFGKLFTSEYTGWKAAEIFVTGGTISGKGKQLTIIFPEGRTVTGKRKITQSQLRMMILEKKVRLVPTPRGMLIILNTGGLTKTGKIREGTRSTIIGILKHSVDERKRINFYETINAGSSAHQEFLEDAVDSTMAEVAANKNIKGA